MPSAGRLPITVTSRTGVPIATSRQVLRRLKEGGLIPAGHSARRLRPSDVSRILIALAVDRMADVPEATKAIEALPLTSSLKAPPTAGMALAMLCAGLLGMPGFGEFDLREGAVDVSAEDRRVTISCRDRTGRPVAISYGGSPVADRASRILTAPFSVIRALAGALTI